MMRTQELEEKKEIERWDLAEKQMEEAGKEEEKEEWKRIPPWTKQITARGLIASLLIGSLYSIISMKLVLTTGVVPTLNVSAALMAFLSVRGWTKVLHKCGFVSTPFTRQENTVIQTCAVACYTIAMAGGFGSYLLGLNKKTYELAGVNTEGNLPGSYKEPEMGWIVGYLFVSSFVGVLTLVPLRKIMIIDYKLTYPSGTATAVLINGFHTPTGDKIAKEQVRGFLKYFSISLMWGFFQWFYSGGGDQKCGFSQFPIFGLQAWKQTFYFNFDMTYVGAGMICSHLVNLSMILGAVLSWGIMWPLISQLKGDWYPETIPESSMKSLNGYKIFIAMALILGDGLYHFLKIMYTIGRNIQVGFNKKKLDSEHENQGFDDLQKIELFMRESIPVWIACVGYIFFSIVSVIAIPMMFPQLKWYFVVVAYVIAPPLCFCNAYGTGLTDMNMSYNYGKIALFVIASIVGKDSGSAVAALIGCGLIKSVAQSSSDLMHDFKTAYLTHTSPRAMIICQLIGTAVGCIVGPLSFFLYYKTFDIGNPDGDFKAPFALIYRNMAILGVEGFSALPQHCLQLCYGFFAFAVGANMIRDFSGPKIGKWVPIPMAMAVPFIIGAYFAIDMGLGSLVVYVWHKVNNKKASIMVPAVASGLICGDGLWILPSAMLALAKVNPPMCMRFLPFRK
ncbi:metal-nicotianamine transporter YSL2-like [Telopea speciosissima]|uniref:metal-nicotianamine transporter YSL2-like n=1 Tax=Telopea speciosissima TaxID=54955 RepID=UPI001CC4AFF3|nr:metal-nicotianamine transporter YSL2-like [Telopea speciosissima]